MIKSVRLYNTSFSLIKASNRPNYTKILQFSPRPTRRGWPKLWKRNFLRAKIQKCIFPKPRIENFRYNTTLHTLGLSGVFVWQIVLFTPGISTNMWNWSTSGCVICDDPIEVHVSKTQVSRICFVSYYDSVQIIMMYIVNFSEIQFYQLHYAENDKHCKTGTCKKTCNSRS